MILEASEIVLGFLGFDRNVYSGNFNKKDRARRPWYEELREERIKDIQDEMAKNEHNTMIS